LAVLLEQIGIGASRQALAFQALDKIGRSEYAGRARALLEDGASEAAIAALEELPAIRTWADLEARFPDAASAGEPLHRTIAALEAMGLEEFVDLDLTIVRGLAYYTGTVFELFDAQRSLRAICGGGRYDDLLQRVGGVDLPALGFGMGDVVLGELLRERGLAPHPAPSAEVFVVGATPEDRPTVLRLAHELRDGGLRVEYALGDLKVGKQLELASARRARFAVVIGPEERGRNAAVLKDLESRAQRELPLAGLPEALALALRGTGGVPA
ncbi:MAG TPA: ATP phosphoribosyltransferase regulatory subunit, partial [Gemmatimonadales bacterium]